LERDDHTLLLSERRTPHRNSYRYFSKVNSN
jgi:hypothetical protein